MARTDRVLLIALAALLLSLLANFCLGASGVTVGQIAGAIFHGDRQSVAARIFLYVRWRCCRR